MCKKYWQENPGVFSLQFSPIIVLDKKREDSCWTIKLRETWRDKDKHWEETLQPTTVFPNEVSLLFTIRCLIFYVSEHYYSPFYLEGGNSDFLLIIPLESQLELLVL